MLSEASNWSPPICPSSEELSDLSMACNKLWELDMHRLVPGHDYVLDLQRGKGFYDAAGDVASQPLFSFVDEAVFERPTFRAFVSLLDNYVAETGRRKTAENRFPRHALYYLLFLIHRF